MSLNAKLAYLLCTCPNFADSFYATIIKPFAKNKIVATRHMFVFFINLFEPTDSPNHFAVDNIEFKFANSDNIVLAETLQAYNNIILDWEMPIIYNRLKQLDINLDAKQIISLYTIASLIKRYKSEYKYIFIPVVINYGRSSNLLHQTALIIDCSGKFLYYEPYGKYKKYNKSYKECICNLFMSLDIMFYDSDSVSSVTYHNNFKLDAGIQDIILKKNNDQKQQFDVEYNELVKRIKDAYTIDLDYINTLQTEDEKTDYTIRVMELVSRSTQSRINKDLYYDVLNMYYRYNSKTCVSITLVEMYHFFMLSDNDIIQRLQEFYLEFNTNAPNVILLEKLNKLFKLFRNCDGITNIINNNIYTNNICKRLYSPHILVNQNIE